MEHWKEPLWSCRGFSADFSFEPSCPKVLAEAESSTAQMQGQVLVETAVWEGWIIVGSDCVETSLAFLQKTAQI